MANKWLVIGLLLLGAPVYGQVGVGVSAILNRVALNGDSPPPGSWSPDFSYGFGLSAELDLGNDVTLTFQPAFEKRATSLSYDVPIEGASPSRDTTIDSAHVHTTHLSFPVGMRVYSTSRNWYFSTGASVVLQQKVEIDSLGTTQELENALKEVDVMLYVGAGYQIPLDPIFLNIELRYNQGLVDLIGENQTSYIRNSPVVRMGGLQALLAAEWRISL